MAHTRRPSLRDEWRTASTNGSSQSLSLVTSVCGRITSSSQVPQGHQPAGTTTFQSQSQSQSQAQEINPPEQAQLNAMARAQQSQGEDVSRLLSQSAKLSQLVQTNQQNLPTILASSAQQNTKLDKLTKSVYSSVQRFLYPRIKDESTGVESLDVKLAESEPPGVERDQAKRSQEGLS